MATDDEIKRAYKQKALKHHPDKNRDDTDAEKKFTDISEAYAMLSDPYKRSFYDRFGGDDFEIISMQILVLIFVIHFQPVIHIHHLVPILHMIHLIIISYVIKIQQHSMIYMLH